jgi:hypothetical protein
MSSGSEQSVAFINKLYDNLGYYDYYGSSVIMYIFITLFVFCVFSYCAVYQEKEKIAADWENQRCKPQNMPFAGWIHAPANKSAFQYTGENFNYCVQNILVTITGYLLQPINYLVSALTASLGELSDNINNSRGAMATLRKQVAIISENVMNRILNVVIPIQKIFIALVDTLNKMQGILTSGLYTMLGSYLSLQTLLGAILEMIIKILIALVAVIIGLWAVPVTWPAAASLSAVFMAIAIPMSIIVVFMSEVMHIKSSAIPKLRCFDGDTSILMRGGKYARMCDICPGDELGNGDIVTATMKILAANIDMYILNGVVVSGCHHVLHDGQWIQSKKHPYAIRFAGYTKPYIYCCNTSSKTIHINGTTFADWDELFGPTLSKTLAYISRVSREVVTTETLYQYLDIGYSPDLMVSCVGGDMKMSEITLGTAMTSGSIVYATVSLIGGYCSLLTTDDCMHVGGHSCVDYNSAIDHIIRKLS